MIRTTVLIAGGFLIAAIVALHLEARYVDESTADRVEDMAREMATRERLSGQSIGERLIRLPEDGGAWHFSVWYDDKVNSPASRHLAGMIAGTPRLAGLAAQTHFREHLATNPDWVFTQRYAQLPRPGVLLQDATGKHIFQACGNELPTSGEALADAIADSLENVSQCGPDGCFPQPRPQVDPPQASGPKAKKPLLRRRDAAEPSDNEKVAIALAVGAIIVLLIFVIKKGK